LYLPVRPGETKTFQQLATSPRMNPQARVPSWKPSCRRKSMAIAAAAAGVFPPRALAPRLRLRPVPRQGDPKAFGVGPVPPRVHRPQSVNPIRSTGE
jgi:hypothetical protein